MIQDMSAWQLIAVGSKESCVCSSMTYKPLKSIQVELPTRCQTTGLALEDAREPGPIPRPDPTGGDALDSQLNK